MEHSQHHEADSDFAIHDVAQFLSASSLWQPEPDLPYTAAQHCLNVSLALPEDQALAGLLLSAARCLAIDGQHAMAARCVSHAYEVLPPQRVGNAQTGANAQVLYAIESVLATEERDLGGCLGLPTVSNASPIRPLVSRSPHGDAMPESSASVQPHPMPMPMRIVTMHPEHALRSFVSRYQVLRTERMPHQDQSVQDERERCRAAH